LDDFNERAVAQHGNSVMYSERRPGGRFITLRLQSR
jgi:hypothetical protein